MCYFLSNSGHTITLVLQLTDFFKLIRKYSAYFQSHFQAENFRNVNPPVSLQPLLSVLSSVKCR